MANIALVTSEVGHAAATTTKTALESKGHTVTLFAMTAVTSSNLLPFDIIMCVRTLTSGTGYAAFVPLLKGYINTNHKPVLIGQDAAGAGTNITVGLASELKLTTSVTAGNNLLGNNVRASAAHPVWTAIGVTPPADVSVTPADNWITKFNLSAPIAGTVIGVLSAADPSPVVVVAEAGQVLLDSQVAGSKIGFISFLYGVSNYTANGLNLIDALISWALTPPAQVVGTVKDDTDAPLARTVRAYNRATGAFAGSAVSSAVDGTFTINVVDASALHYVIALDELAGSKNAIIKDRVTPYQA